MHILCIYKCISIPFISFKTLSLRTTCTLWSSFASDLQKNSSCCRRSFHIVSFDAPAIKNVNTILYIRACAVWIPWMCASMKFQSDKSDGWPDCEHPSHDYEHNNFDAVIWFNAFVVQHLRFSHANLFICEFLIFLFYWQNGYSFRRHC